MFIVDNIYRKYPKVKAKYDGVAKMWDSLPTNAELFQRQSLTEEEMVNELSYILMSILSSCSLVQLVMKTLSLLLVSHLMIIYFVSGSSYPWMNYH